ncbi:hypothetical protein C8F01DRAFT_1238960 [Mycena amicta]|nr:hypothetical protein C8F01DRAFT_1238960 [Mycena amicta]
MSATHEHDEQLTATVFGAIQSLSSTRKANLLLDTALALIGGGQYGPEVENYIEVYLRTPYLPRKDVVRALLARGSARKAGGESLIAKAEQDFRAVQKLDPTNRDLQRYLQREKVKIAFAHDRAPLEVWERIASFIPRYHLRTWLFISPFHREIAVRLIFHTLDLYFAEDQQDALNRGLDVFYIVKADAVFEPSLTCTLGHVAALIARHIEVFGPPISRRVPGPERLMPIGIHLGVFRAVLLTTNALSKFCIGASDSSSSTTEDHFGPFIRTLAPALSLPALTKCLKQLGRIPVGEDVGTNNSPWDGALYEMLSLLSASLMIDRHGISSALRHGLVPALARCCQRELFGRTARKVAFFVANILGPATMLRSLGKYIKSDREEVAELVAEARAAGEAPQIMDLLDLWCEMADRHLLMLRLRREMDMCAYASCENKDIRPHLRCSGCATRLYCSRVCQKADWAASHRTTCAAARAVRPPLGELFSSSDLRSIGRILRGHYLANRAEYRRHTLAIQKQFNEPAVIISDFFRWQPDKRMPFLESFPLGDAQLRERIVKDDPTWDDWVERSWRSDGGLALHVVRLPVGDEWGPYNSGL